MSMKFEGFEAAHLLHALAGDLTDAVDVLLRQAADGSWKKAPEIWCFCAERILERAGSAEYSSGVISAAEAATSHESLESPCAHTVLRWAVSAAVTHHFHDLIETVTSRMLRVAGPGDASLLADLFERMYSASPTQALMLYSWMLAEGSAELRSPRRLPLLATAVACAVAHGKDEDAIAGIRLLWNTGGLSDALAAIALEDAVRVTAFSLTKFSLPEGAIGECCENVPSLADRLSSEPASNAARQRASMLLVGGFLGANLGGLWWKRALVWGVDVEARIATLDGLRQVVAAVRDSMNSKPSEGIHVSWVHVIVASAASLYELNVRPPTGEGAEIIKLLARSHPVTVKQTLLAVIRDDNSLAHTLCVSLLREVGREPFPVVLAALAALEQTHAVNPRVGEIPDVQRFTTYIQARLHHLLNVGGHEQQDVRAVAKLLNGVRAVRIVDLEGDDQVSVRGDTLLVNRAYPASLWARELDVDKRDALSMLFVAHELVHVAQRIGSKPRVVRLRATGHETTLMHLDLSADHAAAAMVTHAVPRWHMPWLKNLQGESIADFPAGATHTAASRARKAHRLVNLRVDFLWRSRDASQADMAAGYYFADYAPFGGHFLLFSSGPPWRVEGECSVSSEVSQAFEAAVDAGVIRSGGLRDLDVRLSEVLDRCAAG